MMRIVYETYPLQRTIVFDLEVTLYIQTQMDDGYLMRKQKATLPQTLKIQIIEMILLCNVMMITGTHRVDELL